MDDPADDLNYKRLNRNLTRIIRRRGRENCLEDVKSYLLPYNAEQRYEILHSDGYGKKYTTNPIIYTLLSEQYLPVIEYLLKECKADVNVCSTFRNGRILGFGSYFQITPLFFACLNGRLKVIEFLYKNGADIFWTDNRELMPVHAAIRRGHIKVVNLVLELMGEIDVRESSSYLSYLPNEQMLHFLLSKGFNPNVKDYKGFTSLHRACAEGSYKTVMMLLRGGADLNMRDDDGLDAILTAAKNGQETTLNLLSSQMNAYWISVLSGVELLGAVKILDENEHEYGYKLWEKALFMRYANPYYPFWKPLVEPKEIFEYATEFQTIDELEALKDQIQLLDNQAVLVFERILGLNHSFTLDALCHLANRIGNGRRSFNILMFVRNVYHEKDELDFTCVSLMCDLTDLFYGGRSTVFSEQEVLSMLSMLYQQMKIYEDEKDEVLDEINEYEDEDSVNDYQDGNSEGENLETMQNYENVEKTGCDVHAAESQLKTISGADKLGESNKEIKTEQDTFHVNGISDADKYEEINKEPKTEHDGEGKVKDCIYHPEQFQLLSSGTHFKEENRFEAEKSWSIASEKTHDIRDCFDQLDTEKCSSEVHQNKSSLEEQSIQENELSQETQSSKYSTHSLDELNQFVDKYDRGVNKMYDCSLFLFSYLLSIGNLKMSKATEELFRKFIAEDFRGPRNESMLHSVVDILSENDVTHSTLFLWHKNQISNPIVSSMFDYILCSGADIDAFDNKGNTPLHYALRPVKKLHSPKGVKPNDVVKKLLNHGAHLDYSNEDYECTLDILRDMDVDVDEVRDTTLQCLAAAAVMQFDSEELPVHLHDFVESHRKKMI